MEIYSIWYPVKMARSKMARSKMARSKMARKSARGQNGPVQNGPNKCGGGGGGQNGTAQNGTRRMKRVKMSQKGFFNRNTKHKTFSSYFIKSLCYPTSKCYNVQNKLSTANCELYNYINIYLSFSFCLSIYLSIYLSDRVALIETDITERDK